MLKLIKRHQVLIFYIVIIIVIAIGVLVTCSMVQTAHNQVRFSQYAKTNTRKQRKDDYHQDVFVLKHGYHGKPSYNTLAKRANAKHYDEYKESSDGNYWSYYRNHVVPSKAGSKLHFTDTVNEKILSKHGVNSGPNFE